MFEEAIAIASLLLDANSPVAATVRTAGGFIDNSFQVQWRAVRCRTAVCSDLHLCSDHEFCATASQTGHLPTQIFQNLPGMYNVLCKLSIDLAHRKWQVVKVVWHTLTGTMTHAPVLLIANRATASASEVLAGALRENGR